LNKTYTLYNIKQKHTILRWICYVWISLGRNDRSIDDTVTAATDRISGSVQKVANFRWSKMQAKRKLTLSEEIFAYVSGKIICIYAGCRHFVTAIFESGLAHVIGASWRYAWSNVNINKCTLQRYCVTSITIVYK